MSRKTILITGSTDGIGLATAKKLFALGHTVLLHGRNGTKLAAAEQTLRVAGSGQTESFTADLSRLAEVETLASAVAEKHAVLDVLINNAGVFSVPEPRTSDGLDVRFVVNTIAPYLLTARLLPLMGSDGRVINLSSAAQAPVSTKAIKGQTSLSDDAAYAQSKLALTAWSNAMAAKLGDGGPVVVAVNPGSLLGTKMVKHAYGMDGADVGIGADILVRAALSDDFKSSSGRYFDNDSGRFRAPHPDALDSMKSSEIVDAIESIIAGKAHPNNS